MKRDEAVSLFVFSGMAAGLLAGLYEGVWSLNDILAYVPYFIMAGMVGVLLWGFRDKIETIARKGELHEPNPKLEVKIDQRLVSEPRVLLTNGLGSYAPAAQRGFPDAVHVAGVGSQGRLNNNRMERYHETLKERTKVMRALKNNDTAILDGQRIYYNHIRPHQGLNGKTPAQAAGLELGSERNRRIVLIRNASEERAPES